VLATAGTLTRWVDAVVDGAAAFKLSEGTAVVAVRVSSVETVRDSGAVRGGVRMVAVVRGDGVLRASTMMRSRASTTTTSAVSVACSTLHSCSLSRTGAGAAGLSTVTIMIQRVNRMLLSLLL